MQAYSLTVAFFILHFCAPYVESGSGKRRKKTEQGPRKEYFLNEKITVEHVKEEFEHEFGGFHKPMLCSACKLSARMWSDELHSRPEVNSSDDKESYYALKAAFEATCDRLPDPLVGVPGESGPEFKAYDDVARVDKELAEKSKANAKHAGIMALRMCIAVLEDQRTAILTEISRQTTNGLPIRRKWERLLCARGTQFCKMQEVGDDDEDESESEGQVTDSVEKQAESKKKRDELMEKAVMSKLISAAMSGDKAEVLRLAEDFKKKGITVPRFVTDIIAEDQHDPELYYDDKYSEL